jgi:YHS domain-containing protein
MFFVRLILVGLLISLAIKILSVVGRYLYSQFGQPQVKAQEDSTGINEMVRDPVCGLFIPSDGAISLIDNGKIVRFCSENCRKKFLDNQG